jgi:hypothetical protein
LQSEFLLQLNVNLINAEIDDWRLKKNKGEGDGKKLMKGGGDKR